MSEEFRQERKKVNVEDFARQLEERNAMMEEPTPSTNAFENVKNFQKEVARETGKTFDDSPFSNSEAGLKMSGNTPAEFLELIKNKKNTQAPPEKRSMSRNQPSFEADEGSNESFQNLLTYLQEITHQYEPIELPSRGRFYTNIPGVLHIRPMTGEEEQVLATQRLVRQGIAIDKIFEKCIQEKIPVDELLAVDRTYILIYLRGISYTPEYDVEIKCPECGEKYSSVINLDILDLELCPDDFGPRNLEGVLPSSKFKYSYRMPTGVDENEVSRYRDSRIDNFGEGVEDDTMLYRIATLLNYLEGNGNKVVGKKDLLFLLKKMPINDVSHLRNKINKNKFGVNTIVDMVCPRCEESFQIDLPLETSFFFPQEKEE